MCKFVKKILAKGVNRILIFMCKCDRIYGSAIIENNNSRRYSLHLIQRWSLCHTILIRYIVILFAHVQELKYLLMVAIAADNWSP